MQNRSVSTRQHGLWILLLSLAVPTLAHASISGVCPDGSFFIVQRAESIPCRDAKRVEPSDLPPLKPEMLPRPYAWERFQRAQDPNNPYNLVDAAPDGSPGTLRPVEALPSVESRPPVAMRDAPRAESRPAPPSAAKRLTLSATDVRDLSLIVQLSQDRAPAVFSGVPGLTLRLAHSRAFEPRLHAALGDGGGTVVLFHASAESDREFHPNLTFVQGHKAFHPDPEDVNQLGMLSGEAGALTAGDSVLGYVVLPDSVDLSLPVDIYWDDRRLSTTLRP